MSFAGLGTFESLRIRDYRLLWLGQVSTSLGQWMDIVTRGWLIYSLTGSSVQLGFSTAIRGVPLLLFSLLAGALADRSGRKLTLVVSQMTNAGLNVVLATLVVTGLIEPWHVYVAGFVAGSVQAFQQPARQTLVGDIVGNRNLMNALALNSAALNGSRAIGPGVAGALIVLLGVGGSYYLQAAMYLLATVWTVQMHVPTQDSLGRISEPILQSIRGGFAYVAKEASIRTQILMGLGPLTFGMSYNSMMPVIARDVLHGGAALQGILLSCIGAGALAGALFVASMRRSHAYGLSVVLGGMAFSGAVFAFASSPWPLLSAVIGVFMGAFSVTYTTQNQTLLQISAPRHLRGRVMSIYMLDRGTVPLVSLLTGFLVAEYGGPTALRIMSSVAMAIVGVAVLTYPRILRLKVSLRDEDGNPIRVGRHGAASTAPAGEGAPSAARPPT